MSTTRRIAAATGVAGPVIAYGAIFVATILFQDFSWLENALSHTGAVGGKHADAASASVPVFNYGLIAAGIIVLPYVWLLWMGTAHVLQKAGVAAFGLAALSLSCVGLFPVGSEYAAYHTPAALAHYISFSFGLWFYGTGGVLVDRTKWGLVTMWIGIVHLLLWIFWAVGTVLGSPVTGLAIPEFLGGLIFGTWIGGTALHHLGVGPLLFE
jgi:hypothetical membrane protein